MARSRGNNQSNQRRGGGGGRGGRQQQQKTYDTANIAWLKDGRNGHFISGIISMTPALLEEALDRYYNGDPDTVDPYDEGRARIFYTLSVDDIDGWNFDDSCVGSASIDNPVSQGNQRGGRGRGRGRGGRQQQRGRGGSRGRQPDYDDDDRSMDERYYEDDYDDTPF